MIKTGGLGGGAPQEKNCSSIEKIIRISISKTRFWRGILREIFKTPFLEGVFIVNSGDMVGPEISWKEALILIVGALRGAIGLGLALLGKSLHFCCACFSE